MADFTLEGMRATLKKAAGEVVYSTQVDRALALAYRGHDGQFRDKPDGGPGARVPYIVHPVGVAILCLRFYEGAGVEDSLDDVLSAGLTHDLLEDTEVTPSELERETSQRTMQIVAALTKPLVQQGLTRQDRDARLLQQIVRCGRTAGYVKICDFLHNIGRPEQTPLHILEKAVRKGRSLYIQLFEELELPAALRAEYLARLESAENHARASARAAQQAPVVIDLSEAVRHCVEHADRKVLERHDIVELLATAFGTGFVRAMPLEDFLDHVLLSGEGAESQKTRARTARGLRSGEMLLSSLRAEEVQQGCKSLSRILATPRTDSTGAASASDFIFVGVPAIHEPHWASAHSLRMLYGYVSERLRLQERKRATDLESTIAKLKLGISPSEVLSLQFTHDDLHQLRSLLDYAEFVRGHVLRAVEFELVSTQHRDSVVRIESRVKTAPSIVAKMSKRRMALGDIDDLVGLRFVCLSQRDAVVLLQILDRCVKGLVGRTEDTSERTRLHRAVISAAGYCATHAQFGFPGRRTQDRWIGCEVQIRTVNQDAWARVSEHLSYKKSRTASIDVALDELAELRDRADGLVNKIASSSD